MRFAGEPVTEWRFEGVAVTVPHVWGDLTAEGPFVYETEVVVEAGGRWLTFEGVSYAAEVWVDGACVLEHRGIWDAFAVRLEAGRRAVRVVVTKNGGARFPVPETLSGFLPYVYGTFGGIHGQVWLVEGREDPTLPLPPARNRIEVVGRDLHLDGEPFWMRGVLHWGWYPEAISGGGRSPHATEEEIDRECGLIRAMGFNTVKFCLWTPPQRYFEALDRHGLWAWMELPLWLPGEGVDLEAWEAEVKRIVGQYRQQHRIVAWTLGCELSGETPPEFRERMVAWIQAETGAALVKDNSGGAEMYGGDAREYGTFDDFHPYCDGPWFGSVLESLGRGGRGARPILLGETCDCDTHRSLVALRERDEDWASADPRRNAQGVRSQYDLPRLMGDALADAGTEWKNEQLRRFSVSKSAFVRRKVAEMVRLGGAVSGWVLTGLRDTPISTSGFLDDAGELTFGPQHWESWNGPAMLGLFARRCPQWQVGGNRPGWWDAQCVGAGRAHFTVGVHSEVDLGGEFWWRIEGVAEGLGETQWVSALEAQTVGEISVELAPGRYLLTAGFAGVEASWTVRAFAPWAGDAEGVQPHWDAVPPEGGVGFFERVGTVKRPFWRECVFDFADARAVPFANRWEWLWPVSGDAALDPEWLRAEFGGWETVMERIDTRTYERLPLIVRAEGRILAALRPQGGHGQQPPSLGHNPAGAELIRALGRLV